ncbi:CCRP1 [Symbiodinium pilosum]|uniref:CCRP1 protein n=1 Tax=Symbiodinium pilosum TaxID=2952 RepID=A0A812MKG0_SYMPI|nr:CCRP1 [Symbiodinium pilosum]
MSWPLPDRVFLPDIRKEGFWARRADVGTFGHCMSALQLGLQLLANLVALCCSLEGGFAKCYEVQDLETKEIFAAKIVSKASITKPRAHAKLRSEIAIHRELSHDKVVKFYDYFEDSDHVYIMLELCPNQTLNEFMRRRPTKRLAEPEAIFYVYELIVALQYLHRRRVIHRDLKLGNLFLDHAMRLKVGDFGLAAQLEYDGERKRTICGTPNYIAPEILEGKYGHSFEVDIWSLGVIIYTMVIGRPPFETSDVKTTYKRIRINQYSFPDSVRISPQAKDLIGRILQTDPGKRPSLEDILNSSWFRSSRVPPLMPDSVTHCSASPRMQAACLNYAGLTPTSARQPALSPLANAIPNTPGRCQQGRPPLAVRGNKENIAPSCLNHDVKENGFMGRFMPTLTAATCGCSGVASNKTLSSARLGDSARILDSPTATGLGAPGTAELEIGGCSARRPSPRVAYRDTGSSSPALRFEATPRQEKSTHNCGLNHLNFEVPQPRADAQPRECRRAQSERPERPQEVSPSLPDIWVTRWVDYASKYGVGYVLSDGSIGVHFNDSTKIVLVPSGSHFDYVTRRTQEKAEERTTYNWEAYPEDLKKKVTLLRHFKNYMMTDILERKDGASAGESSLKPPATASKATYAPGQVPFVKKWTRNKHAIMFQLSNKTVQVIFFDKTEAVLSSRSHLVTYVDKKGQVQAYPLTNVLDVPSAELAKRLRYTKDDLSCFRKHQLTLKSTKHIQ